MLSASLNFTFGQLIVLLSTFCGSSRAQKVEVNFYGESLCPYCAGLTTTELSDVFKDGLDTITVFRYIGWGNVQKEGSKYVCQHGALECTMNTVLNCGQAQSSSQRQFFDFLFCIESQAGPDVKAQIPGCAKAANLDLKALEKCYTGSRGEELDARARDETDALQPAHTYVPWVTVNGVPIFEQTDLLASYICVAFNGTRPEACYRERSRSRSPSPNVHRVTAKKRRAKVD